MTEEFASDDGTGARHLHARQLAEQAIRAQTEGEDEKADLLFAEAARIDPDAVANALSAAAADPMDGATGSDADPQDDAALEAISRTVEPESDAPSRSGVGGRGSGADGQGS